MKKLIYLVCLGLIAVSPAAASDSRLVADLDRAAQWQIDHPSHARPESSDTKAWVMGVFYAGLAAYDKTGADGHRFLPELIKVGNRNQWQLGPREYHADDLTIGQSYEDVYETDHDPRQITQIQKRLDHIIAHPSEGPMDFRTDGVSTRWNWCDALFMAPEAWTHLSNLTGNPAYRDYAIVHWWKTSDYLYDPAEHLYYRDSRYRPGPGVTKKVFWGRGNGWVFAGLARVMADLPVEKRPDFEKQFREMAEHLRAIQSPDGGWQPDLLHDPMHPLASEASGTALFCFGFAWGVNHGVLAAANYGPVAERAFAYLRGCEQPDGRVTHMQPIGYKPTEYPADGTAPFGVGGYLLAGSEMLYFKK
ncbi:MAG TPA: glycoside hydrolase family 88 protein [Opitutaceae bacterium]|jgi:rhamnogalacturonyl hydrolase YesR